MSFSLSVRLLMDTPTVTDVPRDVPVAMDVGFDAGAPMCLGLRAACADDNTCCAGSVCQPSPTSRRCCRSGGQACGSSLECCGYMLCSGGVCALVCDAG